MHPLSLLFLVFMPERGLLNRHGLLLFAILVFIFLTSLILINYQPFHFFPKIKSLAREASGRMKVSYETTFFRFEVYRAVGALSQLRPPPQSRILDFPGVTAAAAVTLDQQIEQASLGQEGGAHLAGRHTANDLVDNRFRHDSFPLARHAVFRIGG